MSLRFGLRALFAVLVAAATWALCTLLFLRGETDEAYGRISSPPQSSLILGTSRAAQGLYPAAFASVADSFAGPMYNFAFTSATSPWGPTYLRAIQHKLAASGSKPGLFVLEVSPLALSVDPARGFREQGSFLARLHSFTANPNVEYPFYQSERGVDVLEGLLQLIRGPVRKRLHADGWLEITLKDDKARFNTRLRQKLAENAASYDNTQDSPERWQALVQAIQLLQARGHVALVRLPMHPEMLQLERDRRPGFSERVAALARVHGATFVDLTDLSPSIATTDGSHLAKKSARQVTEALIARLPPPWFAR